MAWVKNQDNSGGNQRDYLNAPDTAGRPMALASILFTLLVIAALALLLFTTGRWAYNQMTQEESSIATTSEQSANESQTGGAEQESGTQTNGSGDTNTATGAGQSASTEASDAGTTSESSTAQSSGASGNSSSETTTTSPNTGPSTPEAVPNTGPSSVVSLFALTTVVAAFAHNRWVRVKNHS